MLRRIFLRPAAYISSFLTHFSHQRRAIVACSMCCYLAFLSCFLLVGTSPCLAEGSADQKHSLFTHSLWFTEDSPDWLTGLPLWDEEHVVLVNDLSDKTQLLFFSSTAPEIQQASAAIETGTEATTTPTILGQIQVDYKLDPHIPRTFYRFLYLYQGSTHAFYQQEDGLTFSRTAFFCAEKNQCILRIASDTNTPLPEIEITSTANLEQESTTPVITQFYSDGNLDSTAERLVLTQATELILQIELSSPVESSLLEPLSIRPDWEQLLAEQTSTYQQSPNYTLLEFPPLDQGVEAPPLERGDLRPHFPTNLLLEHYSLSSEAIHLLSLWQNHQRRNPNAAYFSLNWPLPLQKNTPLPTTEDPAKREEKLLQQK